MQTRLTMPENLPMLPPFDICRNDEESAESQERFQNYRNVLPNRHMLAMGRTQTAGLGAARYHETENAFGRFQPNAN
jgi:hypothetical protein